MTIKELKELLKDVLDEAIFYIAGPTSSELIHSENILIGKKDVIIMF